MSDAIKEMKKTLSTEKKPEVKKMTSEKKVVGKTQTPQHKGHSKPSVKPSNSKTFIVGTGGVKSPLKRFSEAFEKAVVSENKNNPPPQIPEVIVKIEVNNTPPWEDQNTTVTVKAPNIPETVVSRISNQPKTETAFPEKTKTTADYRPASIGILGTGFRDVGTSIKR